MRYFAGLLFVAIGAAFGCGGANNMNTNTIANQGNALRNINVSNPPKSPIPPPPTMAATSNTSTASSAADKRVPPGMANEKMTPARMPPGLLGTPNKQPTPR
jgi:hypothetical protein